MNKKLKIGFAGNTNNYPYTLALAFDSLGHDVKFIVDSTYQLHRPEFRFLGSKRNNINILDVSPVTFSYWTEVEKEKVEQMRLFFTDRDVLILNSDFVSLYSSFNVPHVVLLTGSDLDFLASEKYIQEFERQLLSKHKESLTKTKLKLLNILSYTVPYFSKSEKLIYSKNRIQRSLGLLCLIKNVRMRKNEQAAGIRKSPFIIGFPKGLNKSGEMVLNKIRASHKQRVFNLMTDTNSITYYPPQTVGKSSVRLFNVARFNWKIETAPSAFTEMDFKGNDVMLRGIALFVKKHPDYSIEVVFVRKGENLKDTYDLIKSLGIDHVIVWKDELSQSGVLEEYIKADIIFDQFTTSIVGMGGLDALAVGRPLIANWRPEFYEQYVGNWPVCQATNDKEVCQWLEELVPNPQKRNEIGIASREFVEKKVSSEAFAKRILKTLYN